MEKKKIEFYFWIIFFSYKDCNFIFELCVCRQIALFTGPTGMLFYRILILIFRFHKGPRLIIQEYALRRNESMNIFNTTSVMQFIILSVSVSNETHHLRLFGYCSWRASKCDMRECNRVDNSHFSSDSKQSGCCEILPFGLYSFQSPFSAWLLSSLRWHCQHL